MGLCLTCTVDLPGWRASDGKFAATGGFPACPIRDGSPVFDRYVC